MKKKFQGADQIQASIGWTEYTPGTYRGNA